jgi:hypothetical protein
MPLISVDPAHLRQLKAQVADLAEQAVQGRLVGDRTGDDGLVNVVARNLQSFEPSRPHAVHKDRSNVCSTLKARLPSAERLHASSPADSGRAAARISRRRRTIPVSPPKVDHIGSLALCWETEL